VKEKVRINESIRSPELRVVGADGANLGILSTPEALSRAQAAGLDLIEISPNANPPVAKIMDYGKFQYDEKKKDQVAKSKAHTTETKSVQIKIGTGENDLALKAKKAVEWLKGGDRVKIDLYLWGRYKYMDEKFLKERLERFMLIISEPHKIADPIKKSPKGFTVIIERDKATKKS